MCLGIPGRIVEITDETRKLALVEISGVRRQVNLACIASEDEPLDSLIGEWALVHVGFAMSRINEAEAAETLKILQALGEAQEEINAMKQSAVQL
ncbi:MAG: HypC/HybG/HupF family hydrogenase formation chaperone [Roseovarius sp.]|nr:HypC/HybG/HupF family hydrogenase formation chaperone [Roseovarius sp.]MBK45054.1 HypC/HybG/HupF family hydrogenase formation chaperone [Roseovarius sp.]|tara:strand:- start:2351 stop:2635 length:285 start_codon:yes stop_codon:yes gene_type:complete